MEDRGSFDGEEGDEGGKVVEEAVVAQVDLSCGLKTHYDVVDELHPSGQEGRG